jgi:hypothetical protein
MICMFERFLVDNLKLEEEHTYFTTLQINGRIQVRLYRDHPLFIGIIYVDDVPVLKEVMIDSLSEYSYKTCRDNNFHSFLIEFSSANKL